MKGEDDATLAALMYELQTRDIQCWKAEQAARRVAGIDLAKQKLLSLESPLQWLLELALNGMGPPTPVVQTAEDVGPSAWAASPITPASSGETWQTAPWEQPKEWMLNAYRQWAKETSVRGANDFTSAEMFWRSIKRLLNEEVFPDRRLFRTSGGKRFVQLPPRSELLHGFNRLLGAEVVETDDDADEPSTLDR
jgi:hypothetical protein